MDPRPADPDEAQDQADLAEILAMIERSEADFEAGRAQDVQSALREIAKKHGLKLDR